MARNMTTKSGVQKLRTNWDARFSSETIAFIVTPSTQIGFFVVKLEIDQRAQHLQVGDQSVELRGIACLAIEIADKRLWESLSKTIRIAVRIELCFQIGLCILDLVIGIGHAHRAAGAQMCLDV